MLLSLALALAAPQEVRVEPPRSGYQPPVREASEEGRAALASMQVPAGLRVELYAAEPLLANPVCLDVDRHGNLFIGETFRHHAGVTDIREHMDWLDEDVAARTVEDRVAMIRRHSGEGFGEYTREHERVRLIRDRDGDGAADEALVFADGFDDPAAGIGAALLARDGGLYYTCMPDLWLLRDDDGDGHAEQRQKLSSGYGVHVALLGHDLHGLRIGPDGRLYFSSGDRGFHVDTPRGALAHPDTGAVLRCELDGSDLEVFATGLRNPQDLAFDEHGELFTGDNNSDGGDHARWVHVLEGGDSGWRYSYQWLGEPHMRGPWIGEKLWQPRFAGQAAYIVPPVANLADGPSGLDYYPGTGLLPGFERHFFLVDFRGSRPHSGIHAFTLEPRGASFKLGPVQKLVWGALPTDALIAPDGALWFCDWVEGWNKTGKGRVYRVLHDDPDAAREARRTQEILREGFAQRASSELGRLMEWPDQRVRQEAHLELARRPDGLATLLDHAAQRNGRGLTGTASLHGVWGVGAWSRRFDRSRACELEPLLASAQGIRLAQVIKVLGELRSKEVAPLLLALLRNESAPVRMQAAIALGKSGDPRAVEPMGELARKVGESDPALRHAAILGLSRCARAEQLVALSADPSVDARVAAAVALRRQQRPEVSRFLADPDPRVALEAARAIYDVPIEAGMGALAALLQREELDVALGRRALAAALRLGTPEHARAVAAFAADTRREEVLRWEALAHLGDWLEPPGREPVLGAWRPAPREESRREPLLALLAQLARELEPSALEAHEDIALAWLGLVEKLRVQALAPRLAALSLDVARPPKLRARALTVLGTLAPDDLLPTVRAALRDRHGEVRAAAIGLFRALAPGEGLAVLETSLREGGREELRAVYRALGTHGDARAAELLAFELRRLEAELVPGEVALDLVQAAEQRGGSELEGLLAHRALRRSGDPTLLPWLDSQLGGDAARGKRTFRNKAEVTCLRCHKIDEEGTSEVGPDLRGVGGRLTRLQLVESIVAPNRHVPDEWRTTLLLLEDDTLVEGKILAERDGVVLLLRPDGERQELPSASILERRSGLSAMPEGMDKLLTREELRDLVEFLSGL